MARDIPQRTAMLLGAVIAVAFALTLAALLCEWDNTNKKNLSDACLLTREPAKCLESL